MLDIRHLRSLVAIADAGKLAAAAARVHLTQSALSHQIRDLEEQYDIVLFQRTRSGLRFTQAGERLLRLARETMSGIDQAERDLARIKGEAGGELRIVLECHTCFDWLMVVMDEFRRRWPEVEVDLVSGFHSDPAELLRAGTADLMIGSERPRGREFASFQLFRFEILAVLSTEHRLRNRRRLEADDFAGETLITYPVPEERIDVIRSVLRPANIEFKRRTTELTIAILQLVASRRGLAALPSWGIKNYVVYDYVIAKRIGEKGLWSDLHVSVPRALAKRPFVRDFVNVIRDQCGRTLEGIELLG
jgi:LysR family transcriptional regulator for metE and metH